MNTHKTQVQYVHCLLCRDFANWYQITSTRKVFTLPIVVNCTFISTLRFLRYIMAQHAFIFASNVLVCVLTSHQYRRHRRNSDSSLTECHHS